MRISVNIAAKQFQHVDLVEDVSIALKEAGLDPKCLVLEITESMLVHNIEVIIARMWELKELGVAFAIDDFGTGYSSLSYLKNFPIDILKLDKSFVDDVGNPSENGALAETIVMLGKNLNLQTIAEGIEQTGQVDALRAFGCQFGQGFYLAQPLTSKEVDTALSKVFASAPRSDSPRDVTPRRSATSHPQRKPSDEFPNHVRTAFGRRPMAKTRPPCSQYARRDSRWDDLERLRASHPMMDAVIDEVRGRRIRVGEQWLSDFASCNYLGFDLHPAIIESVAPELARWGTHPSWSRLLGSPRLYVEIEDQLTALLGAPDTLVLPTITLIHTSVIPALAGQGAVLVDSHAHKTIYDGATIARGAGATLHRVRPNDPEHLEEVLRSLPTGMTRMLCIDGVNSMSGNAPHLPEYARLCRTYDALLYIDDAHGFGVIGESPTLEMPYGFRGNSIVRFFDESYENIVLVGGFSKAYSSLLAFMALPTSLKNRLKTEAAPYLYSGPSPTASLATVLAGFKVNETEGTSFGQACTGKPCAFSTGSPSSD